MKAEHLIYSHSSTTYFAAHTCSVNRLCVMTAEFTVT